MRLTLKLAPSLPSDEGIASGWSAPSAMVTAFAFAAAIVFFAPSATALPLVNFTVPKLSSGAIPRPTLGASSIHSADDLEEA